MNLFMKASYVPDYFEIDQPICPGDTGKRIMDMELRTS